MAKEKRFEKIYSEGLGSVAVLRDNETGVNYLCISGASGCGLTPLLDGQGNVVITPAHRVPKGPEL